MAGQRARILWRVLIALGAVVLLLAYPSSCRNAMHNVWIEEAGEAATGIVVSVETSEFTENRQPLARITIDLDGEGGSGAARRAVSDQRLLPHLARVAPGSKVDVRVRHGDPARAIVVAVK